MELENIQTVASLCCGVIGYSWALKFAMGGHEVYAYNRSEESSARAKQRVKESMDSLKKNGVYTDSEAEKILSRIHYTTSLEEAVKNALFIQESSAEHYEVKHALVKEIEAYASPDAIIASSTSGLLVTEIAKYAQHPERFIGGHPYNPPHLIPLVEVVPGSATLPHLARQVSDFCAACALEAVVLNRAAPGFVGNRLQFALLREALHIVHSGIASPEVVDQVMRASLGRRYAMVGPLEAADMTGLATVQDICQHLLPELASGTEMMSLVAEKVARGDTGARSGQGFYRWDEVRHQRIQSRREHQLRFALKP